MNWKESELCKLCGAQEDVNHLLFSCPLAKFLWAFVSSALGWNDYPRDLNDLLAEWLPQKFRTSYQMGLSGFAGLAWSLWITRNKLCFHNTLPGRSIDIVYLTLSNLQKWKILMRPGERCGIEALVERMRLAAQEFKTSNINLYAIVYL
jgi:hypothetical protein